MTPDIVSYDGKTLYEIQVTQTRTATMYVLAKDPDDAHEDAQELTETVRDYQWDEIDTDFCVVKASHEPRDTVSVWTGGENGDDASWESLKQGRQHAQDV